MSSDQRLYGRVASLQIGVPGKTGKLIKSFYIDENTRAVQDGLRFTFKIEKTAESTPNKASIEIYNLAPDTISLLSSPGCTVSLSAGYGLITFSNQERSKTNSGLLFVGDTAKTFTKKNGPDFITTIEAGDGLDAYQNATINESFNEGASGGNVIQRIIGSMGLGTGEVTGADKINYSGNLVLSGNARQAMDDVTAKGGLEWSIQDGQVFVNLINEANNLEAVLLTPQTGLIGSPQPSGFSNSKNKETSGIEFTALLNPGLTPGRRVKIDDTKKANGVFVVRKVTFTGDTRSGPWYSEVEALPI